MSGKDVLAEVGKSWEEIDHIEGNLIYLKDHSMPWRGIPHPDAVSAVNEAKKCLRFLRWPNVKEMAPFILPLRQQQPFTPVIADVFFHFTSWQRALAVAHIFEYDAAYRLRLQDLFRETTQKRLIEHPISEIWRLNAINKRRDYAIVHAKIRGAAFFLTICLLWTPLRRKWKRAFGDVNFTALQPDEIDMYWLTQRKDYHYDA